jgi:hypothetical protein
MPLPPNELEDEDEKLEKVALGRCEERRKGHLT